MALSRPHLSIIIPAHNEAARLGVCLERWLDLLWRTAFDYEIIIVANGCTDATLKICERYHADHEHIRYINLPLRGKGSAVREGMLRAHGTWRYMADVDLSTPPEEVLRFLDVGRIGSPVVIGSRLHPDSVTDMTFQRKMIGRIFHTLIRLALPEVYVTDTQCGFKLFRWDAAEAIFRKCYLFGMAIDVEALYLALRMKYPVREIPVRWIHDGDSRVRLLADSFQMFGDVLRIKRLHRHVYQPRRQVQVAPSPEEVPAD